MKTRRNRDFLRAFLRAKNKRSHRKTYLLLISREIKGYGRYDMRCLLIRVCSGMSCQRAINCTRGILADGQRCSCQVPGQWLTILWANHPFTRTMATLRGGDLHRQSISKIWTAYTIPRCYCRSRALIGLFAQTMHISNTSICGEINCPNN